MNAKTKTSKSGGCGCGGSGKSGGCGCGSGVEAVLCGCGGAGCATCRNQGFVRPRFFAGQLLTEEDLQKMIDYVVGKNRLHNQRLWGDGVVCGLDVSCNPCGGGTVRVNPGYALDCCGNDLLLGCPQDLDINAMVRDLKRNLLGGIDCGDPCAENKKETKKGKDAEVQKLASTTSTIKTLSTTTTTELDETVVEPAIDTTRHYCLYIRYCENLTDPVSPYATDEGCNYQSCQPTRVSEGVKFELRCYDGCGHPADIRDRLCECIGDLDSASQNSKIANDIRTLTRLSTQINTIRPADPEGTQEEVRLAASNFIKAAEPLKTISFQKPLTVEKAPVEKVKSRDKVVVPVPSAPPQPVPSTGVVEEVTPAVSSEKFESAVGDIHTAAAHLAAYYLVRGNARETNTRAVEGARDEKEIVAARRELDRAASETFAVVNETPTSEQERAYYSSLLKRTSELAASNDPQVDIGQRDLRYMSSGLIIRYSDVSTRGMAALREELLERLDRSPRFGDCQLRADVLAIRLPDPQDPLQWRTPLRSVYEAWDRYLKDCICNALNPPCAPCDDPAVLLACLEVKDCEVIEICNLKRKFVISPTALRYWVPPLNYLGELIEKLCCPEPLCEEEDPTPILTANQGVFGSRKRPLRQRIPRRLDPVIFELLCGSRKAGKYPATAYRQDMTSSSGTATATLRRYLSQLWSREVGRSFAATIKTAEGKAEFRALITEELSNAVSKEGFNERLAEAIKARGSATDTAISGLTDEGMAAIVQKFNLGGVVKDLKEVKRIKIESAELKKNLLALEKRLKVLEGGTLNE